MLLGVGVDSFAELLDKLEVARDEYRSGISDHSADHERVSVVGQVFM